MRKDRKPEFKQGDKGRWRWYLRESKELVAQSSIRGYASKKEVVDAFDELFYQDDKAPFVGVFIAGISIGVVVGYFLLKFSV